MRATIFSNMSLTLRFSLVVIVAVLMQTSVKAQEAVRTLERIYELDDAGNAKIEFDFQLGAAQWAKWKDQYGDHPDLMLRNVKYELAAAVIDDFSLAGVISMRDVSSAFDDAAGHATTQTAA